MKIDLADLFERYVSKERKPVETNKTLPPLDKTSDLIQMVLEIFPGAKVLSETETKELLPKLKLAEWEIPQ